MEFTLSPYWIHKSRYMRFKNNKMLICPTPAWQHVRMPFEKCECVYLLSITTKRLPKYITLMCAAFPKQFFSANNYDNQVLWNNLNLEPSFSKAVSMCYKMNPQNSRFLKPIFITKNLYIIILGRVFQNNITKK